ncbi:MAG TPA: DUF2304 domain-containing protein [Acidimicrobiia bacterium]|nr:DUF2304 domain-containing protein [Acidimicrobiia bacterium]
MIIKIILISCFVLVTLYLVTKRDSAKIRAWRKIAMFAFVAFAIFSILYPNIMNDIAEEVGVGRGADLLLYASSVAVVFLGMHSYIKYRQLNQTIVQLARKIALLETELIKKEKDL